MHDTCYNEAVNDNLLPLDIFKAEIESLKTHNLHV